MDKREAHKILVAATGMLKLTREDHQRVLAALQVLGSDLPPSEDKPQDKPKEEPTQVEESN